MEPTDRTYSEHEVAEVIALAVERQRAAERRAESSPPRMAGGGAVGLTLAEVEAVGREVGIDPGHLRAAAAEVAAGGAAPDGGPGSAAVERWADAPLTDAGWEDVVAHLRASPPPFTGVVKVIGTLDDAEAVERLGQSYEWVRTTAGLDVTTRVNVSPRGDRTRVRVTQVGDPTSGGVETSAVIGAALGALAGGGALLAGAGGGLSLAAFIVVTVIAYIALLPYARKSGRKLIQAERARLNELADALVPLVEAAAAPAGQQAETGGAVHPAPELDAALLDPTPPETEADAVPRPRRTRT